MTTSSRCGAKISKRPSARARSHLRLGLRRRVGQARDQVGRGRDRMVALPPHFAQVRDLPVIEPLRVGVRPVQQARDLRRREQGVVLGLQGGELLARKAALPRGIITEASQFRSEIAPRKAWRRLNSCSSCLYGGADIMDTGGGLASIVPAQGSGERPASH